VPLKIGSSQWRRVAVFDEGPATVSVFVNVSTKKRPAGGRLVEVIDGTIGGRVASHSF